MTTPVSRPWPDFEQSEGGASGLQSGVKTRSIVGDGGTAGGLCAVALARQKINFAPWGAVQSYFGIAMYLQRNGSVVNGKASHSAKQTPFRGVD
jgi:hypothetical protein